MHPEPKHGLPSKRRLPVTLITMLFAACSPPGGTDKSADADAIKAMSAARARAFNERDAAGIAVHFTDDGILMAPGSPPASGRDAVEHYYQAIFDQYTTGLESGYEEVRVSGDLAYGRGFAKVTLVPLQGGDTLISTAKYINILQRQPDGTWLTTHDIWNGNE